ncbi:MAG: daunorubicin/doxorubicin resistance ABC transporter ATP-binding protein DrrA, partial [Thermocrispum sp.]
ATAARAAVALTAYGAQHDGLSPAVLVPLGKTADIASIVRALDAAGVPIADLAVSEPSLDDVYVALHSNGWKSP